MKFLIIISLVLFAKASLACSSPKYGWVIQQVELSEILSSSEVTDKLKELNAQQISSIEYKAGKYIVYVSGQCHIVVTPRWLRPSVAGMCPSLDGVEAAVNCVPRE